MKIPLKLIQPTAAELTAAREAQELMEAAEEQEARDSEEADRIASAMEVLTAIRRKHVWWPGE